MAEVIDLNSLEAGAVDIAIEQVLRALQSGEVVVAPLESSYIYACDAFNPTAVQKLHELRGDQLGVAAQVAISSPATLSGIAQFISPELSEITKEFWPGLLSVLLQPNSALNWDLGDAGALSEFAVRVPEEEFLLKVLEKSGPLAIASAAVTGGAPARNLDQISALITDVDLYLDRGELSAGALSTVIRQSGSASAPKLEVVRVGALTVAELGKVAPTILPIA